MALKALTTVAVLTVVAIAALVPAAKGRTCSVKTFTHYFPHSFIVGGTTHIEDCEFTATMCEGSCAASFKYIVHEDTDAYTSNSKCGYDVECCKAKPGHISYVTLLIDPTTDCRGRGLGPTSTTTFPRTNQRVVSDCECARCLSGDKKCSDHSP